jgi:hypothetical protein
MQLNSETTADNLAIIRIFRDLGLQVESRHERQAVLAWLNLSS